MNFVLSLQYSLLKADSTIWKLKRAEASVQGVSGPDRNQLGEHTLETGKEAESSYAPDGLEGYFLFLDSQSAQQYRLCFFNPQKNWK